MRLFKSLFELKRIQIIAETSQDPFSLVTNILSRAFYALYWLFDNIHIIFKYMQIDFKRFSQNLILKLSRIFWLLGLCLFITYCIKILRKTYTDESDLKVSALNKMTVKTLKENLQIIISLRRDYQRNFVRAMSDLLICLNSNNIPFMILGKRLNYGVEGCSGMLASLIYLYGMIEDDSQKVKKD